MWYQKVYVRSLNNQVHWIIPSFWLTMVTLALNRLLHLEAQRLAVSPPRIAECQVPKGYQSFDNFNTLPPNPYKKDQLKKKKSSF